MQLPSLPQEAAPESAQPMWQHTVVRLLLLSGRQWLLRHSAPLAQGTPSLLREIELVAVAVGADVGVGVGVAAAGSAVTTAATKSSTRDSIAAASPDVVQPLGMPFTVNSAL